MMRALLVAVTLLAGLAGAGMAAGALVEPADGERLAAAPAAVRVVVDSPVEPALAQAEVRAPSGAGASGARVDPDDPQAIAVPVPAAGGGTYRVAWWGLTTDGHPVAGSTSFQVGGARPEAAPVSPEGSGSTSPLAIAARFLVLVGVLGTAGMALAREWSVARGWASGGIAPPGHDHAARVRGNATAEAPQPVRRWWTAWWVLLAAWALGLIVALPVQAWSVGGQWRALVSESRWGMAWLGLAVLALVAVCAGLVARRADPSLAPAPWRMGALAVPGAAGAVLLSWSGHAASGTDATLGVAIDVVHGWATALWLGGLVMLLVLAVPLLARLVPADAVRMGAAVVVRFSSLAVASVVVLVITGVYRALAELPSLDALWTTDYGLVLLAKLVVFAVMLVLAGWNRIVLHPRLERRALGLVDGGDDAGTAALRASVRAEVALGAVVMALVAVMVGLMPPT
jgi:copper transport protein